MRPDGLCSGVRKKDFVQKKVPQLHGDSEEKISIACLAPQSTASREKVKGAIIHKAGSKIQHDWLYLQKLQ